MELLFLGIAWILAGWCGTGPRPKPEPNPGRRIIPGIIGGLVGGFFVYFAFTSGTPLELGTMFLTLVGAYFGGYALADLVIALRGDNKV